MADQGTTGQPRIPGPTTARPPGGHWTRDEEDYIVNSLESTSNPLTFQEISEAMPHRSVAACRTRYDEIRARQLSSGDLIALKHLWELLVIPIGHLCSPNYVYSWLTWNITVTATRCFFRMPARVASLLVNLRELRIMLVLEPGKIKQTRAWMWRLSTATTGSELIYIP